MAAKDRPHSRPKSRQRLANLVTFVSVTLANEMLSIKPNVSVLR